MVSDALISPGLAKRGEEQEGRKQEVKTHKPTTHKVSVLRRLPLAKNGTEHHVEQFKIFMGMMEETLSLARPKAEMMVCFDTHTFACHSVSL